MEKDPLSGEFELAPIPVRIVELAKLGEEDSAGFLTARYRSIHEDIDWILVRLIDENTSKCTAIIGYSDGTSYDTTWDEGRVWALTHDDIHHEQYPARRLPYTRGLIRQGYVSNRFITPSDEAKSMLNLTSTLSDIFGKTRDDPEASEVVVPEEDEIPAFITDVQRMMEEHDEMLDGLSKAFLDIDPADVDIAAMSAPIFDIDPVRDRVPTRLPDQKDWPPLDS